MEKRGAPRFLPSSQQVALFCAFQFKTRTALQCHRSSKSVETERQPGPSTSSLQLSPTSLISLHCYAIGFGKNVWISATQDLPAPSVGKGGESKLGGVSCQGGRDGSRDRACRRCWFPIDTRLVPLARNSRSSRTQDTRLHLAAGLCDAGLRLQARAFEAAARWRAVYGRLACPYVSSVRVDGQVVSLTRR